MARIPSERDANRLKRSPIYLLRSRDESTRSPARTATRLLEQIPADIRRRGYSGATERTYIHWIRRFIIFQDKRHPASLGVPHVRIFLTHLAVERSVAASTRNLARNAVIFLYKDVLDVSIGDIGAFERAKTPKRLPVVLSRREVREVLRRMNGVPQLIAFLLYGSGLRI